MKAKIGIGVAILALVALINSCENKSVPLPAYSLPTNCDTISLTYSSGTNTMKPIIDAQCGTGTASCHGSGSKYDYTTYSGISANYSNGTLYSCLFQGTPFVMPQTPQPGWSDSSACMLGKFKAWINAGAPQ